MNTTAVKRADVQMQSLYNDLADLSAHLPCHAEALSRGIKHAQQSKNGQSLCRLVHPLGMEDNPPKVGCNPHYLDDKC